MADPDERQSGRQAHKREVASIHYKPQLEEREKARDGGQRDKAIAAGPQGESEIRNSSSNSSVMACHRQDLPSVEDQIAEAKRRKNETEECYVQQVSASVKDKHSKAEERRRQIVIQEKRNLEMEVAKEASKRDAVLERKRRQEEEAKQRRQAQFEKGEKQRVEALERYAKQKKSPKSSMPNLATVSSMGSPSRPYRVSAPAYSPSSPARGHNASNRHRPRLGQKGPSVFDRLYRNKSAGSLSTIAEEHAPPMKSAEEAKVGAGVAARGKENEKISPKDILFYPGEQGSNKQKKTDAVSSSLKASASTKPTVASPKPAKQEPSHGNKEKQKSEPLKTTDKAASPTAGVRFRPHQSVSPSEPRVQPPSRNAKAGKEQKSGKNVQASSPRVSVGPKSSLTPLSPLATAHHVPKESAGEQSPGIKRDSTLRPSTPAASSSISPPSLDPEVDTSKAQQVPTVERTTTTTTTEYSPRSSHDSGLGQRSSCEESRQPTLERPTYELSGDYKSNDGQPRVEHSTKHPAPPLQPNSSGIPSPEVPTFAIQSVESSDITSRPARELSKTLSGSGLGDDDSKEPTPDAGPRRHSDTPRRKQGITELAPPSILLLDRHGSLPAAFPSNFKATFDVSKLSPPTEADESSDSEDSNESQADSIQDGKEDLFSASKPTKSEEREARRSLVDQIMRETRMEKKELDLKPFLKDHKAHPPLTVRTPSSPILRNPSPLEDGSDHEEYESDSGKERKLSAPAVVMEKASVQFEMPIPYPHPLEVLPLLPSDKEHDGSTEENNHSTEGIYFSEPQPALSPPQGEQHLPSLTTDPIPIVEASSLGAFIDCVSSEDDDDLADAHMNDGLHRTLMDVVISDDDEDKTFDSEFHKLLQVPGDDVIESDSEDESPGGGVPPSNVGMSQTQQSQWMDVVESSDDEAVNIGTSESGRKVDDTAELSPPQAGLLQGVVEGSSCKNVESVSSENENETVEIEAGKGGAVCEDDVTSETDSEEWCQSGGAVCNEDGSISPPAHQNARVVKKDSLLLYSKVSPILQKPPQSCLSDDVLVSSSADEEEEELQLVDPGSRESSIQRPTNPLLPQPLKGILKKHPQAVQMSPTMRDAVESSSDEENLELGQHLTGTSGVGTHVQWCPVPPLVPHQQQWGQASSEDREVDKGTALENVRDPPSTADQSMEDEVSSDSESEIMPDGNGTANTKPVSNSTRPHNRIEYKSEGYGNGSQPLTSKSHFDDKIYFSSDSDPEYEPLSVYGV